MYKLPPRSLHVHVYVLYVHACVAYAHGARVPRGREGHRVLLVFYLMETGPLIETGASLEVRNPQ